MSNSHRVGVIVTQKKNFLSSLGPNFGPPIPTLPPGAIFFSKSNGFLPGSERRLPQKMKLIGSIFLRYFVNWHTHGRTDRQADKRKIRKPRHAKHGRGLIKVFSLANINVIYSITPWCYILLFSRCRVIFCYFLGIELMNVTSLFYCSTTDYVILCCVRNNLYIYNVNLPSGFCQLSNIFVSKRITFL